MPIENVLAVDVRGVQRADVIDGRPVRRPEEVAGAVGVSVRAGRLGDGPRTVRLHVSRVKIVRAVQAEDDVRELGGDRRRSRHRVVRLSRDLIAAHLGPEGGLQAGHGAGEGGAGAERRGIVHLEPLLGEPCRGARDGVAAGAEAGGVLVGRQPLVVAGRAGVEQGGEQRVPFAELARRELEVTETFNPLAGIERPDVEPRLSQRVRTPLESNVLTGRCGRGRRHGRRDAGVARHRGAWSLRAAAAHHRSDDERRERGNGPMPCKSEPRARLVCVRRHRVTSRQEDQLTPDPAVMQPRPGQSTQLLSHPRPQHVDGVDRHLAGAEDTLVTRGRGEAIADPDERLEVDALAAQSRRDAVRAAKRALGRAQGRLEGIPELRTARTTDTKSAPACISDTAR